MQMCAYLLIKPKVDRLNWSPCMWKLLVHIKEISIAYLALFPQAFYVLLFLSGENVFIYTHMYDPGAQNQS